MTTAQIQRQTSTGRSRGSARRLRVCHVSMTLLTGGLERLLVDFARFHDSSRFDVSFVSLGKLGPPAADLSAAGHAVHSVNMHELGKRVAVRKLREMFADQRIDILHTHNTYPQFYGTLAAKWAGVPTVINTQHGRGCGPRWKDLWQFRIANRMTSRVIGVSEDALRLCRTQDPSSATKMRRIWNGIDVDRFPFSGPGDPWTAISVARLSPEKDFPTLLRAVRIVVGAFPQFHLKLVGDGRERPRLEELARDLNVEHNVEFLGERSDVPNLLRTAGFFVSSSKTEGISLTLLEAMSVGLPVVTTRVGGNPEIVEDGTTGKLVPPLNPDALAAAMTHTLQNRAAWPEMARASRARVEEHFNVRKMVEQYERTYLECHQVKSSVQCDMSPEQEFLTAEC